MGLLRLKVGFVDGHADDVLGRVADCESLGSHLTLLEGTCFFDCRVESFLLHALVRLV